MSLKKMTKNKTPHLGCSHSRGLTFCRDGENMEVDKQMVFLKYILRDAGYVFNQRARCSLRRSGSYWRKALNQRDAGKGRHGKVSMNK